MNPFAFYITINIVLYALLYGSLMELINWDEKLTLGKIVMYLCFGIFMTVFHTYLILRNLKKLGIKSLNKETLNQSLSRKIHSELSLDEIYGILKVNHSLVTAKKHLLKDKILVTQDSDFKKAKYGIEITKPTDDTLSIKHNNLSKGLYLEDYVKYNNIVNKIEISLNTTKQPLLKEY